MVEHGMSERAYGDSETLLRGIWRNLLRSMGDKPTDRHLKHAMNIIVRRELHAHEFMRQQVSHPLATLFSSFRLGENAPYVYALDPNARPYAQIIVDFAFRVPTPSGDVKDGWLMKGLDEKERAASLEMHRTLAEVLKDYGSTLRIARTEAPMPRFERPAQVPMTVLVGSASARQNA